MLYIVSCEIVPESNSMYSGRLSTMRKYYRLYIGVKYNLIFTIFLIMTKYLKHKKSILRFF